MKVKTLVLLGLASFAIVGYAQDDQGGDDGTVPDDGTGGDDGGDDGTVDPGVDTGSGDNGTDDGGVDTGSGDNGTIGDGDDDGGDNSTIPDDGTGGVDNGTDDGNSTIPDQTGEAVNTTCSIESASICSDTFGSDFCCAQFIPDDNATEGENFCFSQSAIVTSGGSYQLDDGTAGVLACLSSNAYKVVATVTGAALALTSYLY